MHHGKSICVKFADFATHVQIRQRARAFLFQEDFCEHGRHGTEVDTCCPSPSKWQTIIQGGSVEQLERRKVPGGWIYRSTQGMGQNRWGNNPDAVGLCFVPDDPAYLRRVSDAVELLKEDWT
jgi:hypothetical protein